MLAWDGEGAGIYSGAAVGGSASEASWAIVHSPIRQILLACSRIEEFGRNSI